MELEDKRRRDGIQGGINVQNIRLLSRPVAEVSLTANVPDLARKMSPFLEASCLPTPVKKTRYALPPLIPICSAYTSHHSSPVRSP